MNRKPPSPSRRRARRRRFTRQQTIILILISLLGLAWITAGAIFVASSLRSTQAAPAAALDPTALKAAPLPEEEVSHLSTPPAVCAVPGDGVRQGTVTRVIGPGLLEVSLDEAIYVVRLAGIKPAPGASQQEQLSQVMHQVTEGQPVLLVKDRAGPDSAGPLVRYVFIGEQFLNEMLIRQGLALADPAAPEQSCSSLFLQAEAQARTTRIGIWQPSPVPTSTFMPFVTLNPATQAICDCSKKYDCSDFATHAEAQACFNACNDYNSKLDLDRDGIACEGLP